MQEFKENSQGDEEYKNIPPSPSLGKSQKIAVAALAVFALFTLIMWTVQFKKGLTDPFVYKGPDASDTAEGSACSGPNCPATIARQKAADTDKDGLSDYDELYLHKTSAYLEDSDSDGISDKKEIDAGKDPNCPEGRDCYKTGIDNVDAVTDEQGKENTDQNTLNTIMDQMQAVDPGIYEQSPPAPTSGNPSTADPETLQKLMSGNIDAPTLRKLLLEHGVKKEVLDKIPDDQLLKSFNEALKSQ